MADAPRYTVADLEVMRFTICQLHLIEQEPPCTCCLWGGPTVPTSTLVEDQLRTYMLAGLTSRDLSRHLKEKRGHASDD